MTIIQDGAGTGRTAQVTSENRLDTDAVSRNQSQHINEVYQKLFSLSFEGIDPVGADDYFFYLENTGSEDLHISAFRVSSSVPTEIAIEHVTGTASGGTAAPPLARNFGSSKVPSATIETGVDITGLTKVGRVLFLECAVADTEYSEEIISNIIIPQGTAMAMKRVAATGLINATVSLLGSD